MKKIIVILSSILLLLFCMPSSVKAYKYDGYETRNGMIQSMTSMFPYGDLYYMHGDCYHASKLLGIREDDFASLTPHLVREGKIFFDNTNSATVYAI